MDEVKPIYLNTKRDSIALYPLTKNTYVKESYEGYDLTGPLRSMKNVDAPWHRDGLVFDDVGVYFQYLLKNAGYKVYDFASVLAD